MDSLSLSLDAIAKRLFRKSFIGDADRKDATYFQRKCISETRSFDWKYSGSRNRLASEISPKFHTASRFANFKHRSVAVLCALIFVIQSASVNFARNNDRAPVKTRLSSRAREPTKGQPVFGNGLPHPQTQTNICIQVTTGMEENKKITQLPGGAIDNYSVGSSLSILCQLISTARHQEECSWGRDKERRKKIWSLMNLLLINFRVNLINWLFNGYLI